MNLIQGGQPFLGLRPDRYKNLAPFAGPLGPAQYQGGTWVAPGITLPSGMQLPQGSVVQMGQAGEPYAMAPFLRFRGLGRQHPYEIKAQRIPLPGATVDPRITQWLEGLEAQAQAQIASVQAARAAAGYNQPQIEHILGPPTG